MSLLLLLIVLKNPVKNEYVFDYAKWIQSSKLKFQYTHTQFQYFLIPCHIIHFWQMPPLPSFVSAGWVTLRVQKSLIIKHRVKVATAQTYRHKLKRNKTHKFTLNLVDLFFSSLNVIAPVYFPRLFFLTKKYSFRECSSNISFLNHTRQFYE